MISTGFKGEETGMADIFNKARRLAPCVLILEDLDSLIKDQNRSFFSTNSMDYKVTTDCSSLQRIITSIAWARA